MSVAFKECDAIDNGKTKFCVLNWLGCLNSKADAARVKYKGWTYEGR